MLVRKSGCLQTVQIPSSRPVSVKNSNECWKYSQDLTRLPLDFQTSCFIATYINNNMKTSIKNFCDSVKNFCHWFKLLSMPVSVCVPLVSLDKHFYRGSSAPRDSLWEMVVFLSANLSSTLMSYDWLLKSDLKLFISIVVQCITFLFRSQYL